MGPIIYSTDSAVLVANQSEKTSRGKPTRRGAHELFLLTVASHLHAVNVASACAGRGGGRPRRSQTSSLERAPRRTRRLTEWRRSLAQPDHDQSHPHYAADVGMEQNGQEGGDGKKHRQRQPKPPRETGHCGRHHSCRLCHRRRGNVTHVAEEEFQERVSTRVETWSVIAFRATSCDKTTELRKLAGTCRSREMEAATPRRACRSSEAAERMCGSAASGVTSVRRFKRFKRHTPHERCAILNGCSKTLHMLLSHVYQMLEVFRCELNVSPRILLVSLVYGLLGSPCAVVVRSTRCPNTSSSSLLSLFVAGVSPLSCMSLASPKKEEETEDA